MMRNIYFTNTLTRKKELFEPIHYGNVGMYVCGPTVYGEAHLGHARPGVTYDILYRLLKYLGYKVRYVRNITDVGHLEHDSDNGEDKITKKARIEELEPMEVVQYYTLRYHESMRQLNVLPPSIEPRASAHIIEQIENIKAILDVGYAYISNGSVYFDVAKYNQTHNYGILSGRNLDDTLEGTRQLDGQGDKKNPFDFALWKKADASHIMKWPSPWSLGFPGWHLECSVMGEKYLGKEFDIHGGGMDLMFPHHECEIAQNVAGRGTQGVKYWIHNNMITINGKKMGKSLGNFITLSELFTGSHQLLEQAYTPMTIRFFILQAHYRSTLDFSNEALKAAEKGLYKVLQSYKDLQFIANAYNIDFKASKKNNLSYDSFFIQEQETILEGVSEKIKTLYENIHSALCDDLNTPIALAYIFDVIKIINLTKETKLKLSKEDILSILDIYNNIIFGVLGLKDEGLDDNNKTTKTIEGLMEMVIEARQEAKETKNWTKSDSIRDRLKALGVILKDTKNGAEWSIE